METLIKADIFFFVATIESVVLTVLIAIILYYLVKTGRNLYKISEALQDHFKDSEEFVAELKERLENNMLFHFFFPPPRKRTREKKNSLS